jgi:hypothetical protein
MSSRFFIHYKYLNHNCHFVDWSSATVNQLPLPPIGVSSQIRSKVGHILVKTPGLRINLNIDGTTIDSRSHTHPSHTQNSRLLTSSLYVGVPVPRGTQCMRECRSISLRFCVFHYTVTYTDTHIYVFPLALLYLLVIIKITKRRKTNDMVVVYMTDQSRIHTQTLPMITLLTLIYTHLPRFLPLYLQQSYVFFGGIVYVKSMYDDPPSLHPVCEGS